MRQPLFHLFVYTAPAEPGRSRRGDDADKGVIACGIKTMSIRNPENLCHRQYTDQKENRKDRKNMSENNMVKIHGSIHRLRKMSGFSFLILRTAHQLIQCILEPEKC